MKQKERICSWQVFVANLWYLFFVSAALSPSVKTGAGDRTAFYLYWFICFLDSRFISYIVSRLLYHINKKVVICATLLIVLYVFRLQFVLLVKVFMLLFSIAYIKYSIDNSIFYLIKWVNFNIFVALIQYCAYLISPDLEARISSSAIAELIWGEYAIATFNNVTGAFGGIFSNGFLSNTIRVAGLCNEGGYLTSTILLTICLCSCMPNMRLSRKQKAVFALGLFLSFSKIIVIVIPLLFTIKFKDVINRKLPFWPTTTAMHIAFMVVGWYVLRNAYKSTTFVQRFSGYYMINCMPLKNMLLGISGLANFSAQLFSNVPNIESLYFSWNTFDGYPSIVISVGYIGLILWFVLMHRLGLTTAGLFIVELATMTSTPVSAVSYVVLAWVIALYYCESNTKIPCMLEGLNIDTKSSYQLQMHNPAN